MTAIETSAPQLLTTAPASARAEHPVVAFLVRRVAGAAVTLAVLSVLVFLATAVIPGDAASAILGRQADGPALRSLRQKMGLDHSLIYQYWHWAGGLLRGDLGPSAAGYVAGGHLSVWSQISDKLANSLELAALAFVATVVVSVLLGVASALRSGKWQDHLISSVTLVPAALPEFVLGAILITVFFTWFDLLPPTSLVAAGASPLASPSVLVLPVLTLVGVTVGPAVRMIRAGMLEALQADSVAVARLNGINEPRVIWRYALRNAIAPSVQVFALIAQYLVGGLLIVEFLFGYPGIGAELVAAVQAHDNSEVQSVTMLLAAIYVAITIVADLAVMLLVPKLRTSR